MGIPAGLLKDNLTLQTLVETADSQGGMVYTWTDAGSFRGRISPLSARERLMQNKETMTTTHRIFCDPMIVTPKDRIKWGDYYFEIIGVTNPSEMYHHLELECREINYSG